MPEQGWGRVRAPELRGRGWLNTGGQELTLADLRGKIVLLDFWTFCCVNCLHVLDELRPLEEKYADVLVMVGVHSPKFEHERDPDALAAAVERYGVAPPGARRPRADRPGTSTPAKAWPTLVGGRPRGLRGRLDGRRGPRATGWPGSLTSSSRSTTRRARCAAATGPYVPPPPPRRRCGFPARRSSLPDGTLLVADSAHHRGRGRRRRRDRAAAHRLGPARPADGPASAPFSEPKGCACCRPRWPRRSGTTWWSPTR